MAAPTETRLGWPATGWPGSAAAWQPSCPESRAGSVPSLQPPAGLDLLLAGTAVGVALPPSFAQLEILLPALGAQKPRRCR